MRIRVDKTFALALLCASSLVACAQRGDRAHAAASAEVWEPIDKDFKGCEGG